MADTLSRIRKRSPSLSPVQSDNEKVTNHTEVTKQSIGSSAEISIAPTKLTLANSMRNHKNTTPSPVSQSTVVHPTRRPFGVVEILENILFQLETGDVEQTMTQLLNLREVSPWWDAVIKGSVTLQRKLFLVSDTALVLPAAPTTGISYSENGTLTRLVDVEPVVVQTNDMTATPPVVVLCYRKGEIKFRSAYWPPELPDYVTINPLALKQHSHLCPRPPSLTDTWFMTREGRLSTDGFTVTLTFPKPTILWGQNMPKYTGASISRTLIAQPLPSRMSIMICMGGTYAAEGLVWSFTSETPFHCVGVTLGDLISGLKQVYEEYLTVARPGDYDSPWVLTSASKITLHYNRSDE